MLSTPLPERRLSRPLSALALLTAASLLGGCQITAGVDAGPDACTCVLSVHQVQIDMVCGQQLCLSERLYECIDGQARDQGPCGDEGPPEDGGGIVRRDAGPDDGGRQADGGACPEGGGTCDGDTFVPCDPDLPRRPCRAKVCVPSGEGPVAGCLSGRGYFCGEDDPCIPSLVCAPDGYCREPEACDDECDVEGSTGCADVKTPTRCVRGDSGCLVSERLDACRDGEGCLDGECEAFCDAAAGLCDAGERCENLMEGCVSSGRGHSPTAGYCEETADCLIEGSVCRGSACMPHCTWDEDCLAQLAGTRCVQILDYGVCSY